jgi:hypothetical protein
MGIAANILNKQSRTAEIGLSPSLGAGRKANSSSVFKNQHLSKCYAGLRVGYCEHGK